jgi:hypothetical protein
LQSLPFAPFLILLASFTPLYVHTNRRSRGRTRCPK